MLKRSVQSVLEALVILEGVQNNGIELGFQIQYLLHKFHWDLLLLGVLHAFNSCSDASIRCTISAIEFPSRTQKPTAQMIDLQNLSLDMRSDQ